MPTSALSSEPISAPPEATPKPEPVATYKKLGGEHGSFRAREALARLAGHFTLIDISGFIAVKAIDLLDGERTDANIEAALILSKAALQIQKAHDRLNGLGPLRRKAKQ